MTALSRDARAATRGGSALLILQSVGRVLALTFVVIVTRQLGASQFGRYSIVASVVLMGNFFADVGTTQAVTKVVSQDPARSDRLLSATFAPSFALGTLVYAVAMAFTIVAGYPHVTVVDMAIGAASIPGTSVLTSVLAALDGTGLIARRAGITLLQSAVVAVGGAVPILLGAGIRSAIVALGAAPWTALIVAVFVAHRATVWRSRPRVDWTICIDLLRQALPFAAIAATTAFTARFDVVLLSLLRSRADTATYDLAQRLLEGLTYVSAAICSPALFLLSRRLGQGDVEGAGRAYDEAVRALYLIGLPLSAALGVLAKPIIDVALGSGYHAVALPFQVMASGQWVLFMVFIQMALINASERPARSLPLALASAAIAIALDAVLIPVAGPFGAALAMDISWVITALAYRWFVQRTLGLATRPPSARILTSSAVAAGIMLLLRSEPVLSAVAGLCAYGALLLLTGAVTRRDLARLRSVARVRG